MPEVRLLGGLRDLMGEMSLSCDASVVRTLLEEVSERGGDLWCKQTDDRVQNAGHAVLYLKGFLNWDEE